MKDQSDYVTCAAATANGFAMPYRATTDKKEPKPRRKEALPRAANDLTHSRRVPARRLAAPHRHAFGRAHADGPRRARR